MKFPWFCNRLKLLIKNRPYILIHHIQLKYMNRRITVTRGGIRIQKAKNVIKKIC